MLEHAAGDKNGAKRSLSRAAGSWRWPNGVMMRRRPGKGELLQDCEIRYILKSRDFCGREKEKDQLIRKDGLI